MVIAIFLMILGILAMYLACSPPLCFTGEGPFVFWPGAIMFTGSLIWMIT